LLFAAAGALAAAGPAAAPAAFAQVELPLPPVQQNLRPKAARPGPTVFTPPPLPEPAGDYAERRRRMVERLAREHDLDRPAVLRAMGEVPRHLFVPEAYRDQAYDDVPLPTGWGQTVYQPYIVALMTSLADLGPDDVVLEIGTGSGYHTAVLSRLVRRVYSIEISPPIAARARERLAALGYRNVEVRVGDGYEGWAEHAPFDAVILTAAPPHLPQPLLDQLKVGGRMVAPVGDYFQDLRVVTKTADGLETTSVIPVRLSPMTREVREGGGR
jgi:protein-L-isoaspartate(D-aspartate) O-methyltransferase